MRTDKPLALNMRRKGKSYKEISTKLKISKSTLSKWFSGLNFSDEIKKTLVRKARINHVERINQINTARGDLLKAHYQLAIEEAIKELFSLKSDPLFIAAVSLYWGEGDKRNKNQVRFTNTDPKMLSVFVIFLQKICKVPKNKISLALFIYKDLKDSECKSFWSTQVGIKKFHKTQVLPSRSNNPKKLEYGTCMVVVSNSYLKQKITTWIDHIPEIVLNTVPRKGMRL